MDVSSASSVVRSIVRVVRQQVQSHKGIPSDHSVIPQIETAIKTGQLVTVFGPRGSGKTGLVEVALNRAKQGNPDLYSVSTSGLFSLDTAMTLKSLAAQLPMQYYQEVPNEQELSQSAQDEGAAIHSLRFHLQDLLVDDTLDNRLVFILEEFEKFAQKKQTLYYILLELVAEFPNHLCMIAVTSYPDYLDLLEKRIKSRFRQATYSVYPPSQVEEVVNIMKRWLSVPEETSGSKQWNEAIHNLLELDAFEEIIRRFYSFARDLHKTVDLVEVAMTRLDSTHPYLDVKDFLFAEETIHPNCLYQMTIGLSIVELSLLVSMAVLEHRNVQDYSFNLIHSEYYSKTLEVGIEPPEEATCLRALENLVTLGVVAWHSKALRSLRYHPVHTQLNTMDLAKALEERRAPTWITSWVNLCLD